MTTDLQISVRQNCATALICQKVLFVLVLLLVDWGLVWPSAASVVGVAGKHFAIGLACLGGGGGGGGGAWHTTV